MRKEVTLVTLCVLALTCMGLVMVYSTGMFYKIDPNVFQKHLAFAVVGLFFFFVAANFDYHHFEDPVIRRAIFIVAVGLLLVVLALGVTVGGGQRWIRVAGIGFQPSELARVALIILLAVLMTRNRGRNHEILRGMLPPMALTGLFAALVVFQRDLGMPAMMVLIALVMMYVGGVRVQFIIGLVPVAIAGLVFIIRQGDYRAARIMAFLDPWEYREVHGWQLIQSMSAFAQGGLWGRGPGGSEQKLGYLPAAHTDFIFAVLGEELGLIGSVAIVLVYALLLVMALRIAMNAPDYLGALLAAGVGASIAIQSAFIMGVTTGLLPTKGLPLPFVAYGGTALVMFLISAGILVNVGAQSMGPVTRRQVVPAPQPAAAT